ncbi:hypothetical protein BGZ72_011123 [Mortierella alpina]|nr:hypothetical protein BGZ72_011123 [Mortierella alpina]
MTAVNAAALDNLRAKFIPGRLHRQHALDVSKDRFRSCGKADDDFSVKTIESSKHLCSGCHACINIEGLLKDPIEKGSKIKLKFPAHVQVTGVSADEKEELFCIEGIVSVESKCPKGFGLGSTNCIPVK